MAEQLLTPAESDSYREQLAALRRVRDRDVTEMLRDTRSLVGSDALEESAQIREHHAFLDVRIARLEALLRDARVVQGGRAAEEIGLGCAVEVEYVRTGRRAAYVLTGSGAQGVPGSVSARSPVGRELLGRRRGDVVSIELPSGRAEELRIVEVLPATGA